MIEPNDLSLFCRALQNRISRGRNASELMRSLARFRIQESPDRRIFTHSVTASQRFVQQLRQTDKGQQKKLVFAVNF
jgi:hypothetical protein